MTFEDLLREATTIIEMRNSVGLVYEFPRVWRQLKKMGYEGTVVDFHRELLELERVYKIDLQIANDPMLVVQPLTLWRKDVQGGRSAVYYIVWRD